MTLDGPSQFPTTRFSAIKGLRDTDPERRRVAWDVVISVYWRPAYTHLRMRWKISPESAQDIIQSFFLTAFEKQYLGEFDPGKARFRTYLRLCLDRFVMKENESSSREKRGGDAEHTSLDFASAEKELSTLAAGPEYNPEQLFDREWVRSILMLSILKFRQQCETDDKQIHFKLFEAYDLSDQGDLSYAQLAAHYGLTETTVTNYLSWARRQFRQTVLETIAELTANEQEYREEVMAVLGIKLA